MGREGKRGGGGGGRRVSFLEGKKEQGVSEEKNVSDEEEEMLSGVMGSVKEVQRAREVQQERDQQQGEGDWEVVQGKRKRSSPLATGNDRRHRPRVSGQGRGPSTGGSGEGSPVSDSSRPTSPVSNVVSNRSSPKLVSDGLSFASVVSSPPVAGGVGRLSPPQPASPSTPEEVNNSYVAERESQESKEGEVTMTTAAAATSEVRLPFGMRCQGEGCEMCGKDAVSYIRKSLVAGKVCCPLGTCQHHRKQPIGLQAWVNHMSKQHPMVFRDHLGGWMSVFQDVFVESDCCGGPVLKASKNKQHACEKNKSHAPQAARQEPLDQGTQRLDVYLSPAEIVFFNGIKKDMHSVVAVCHKHISDVKVATELAEVMNHTLEGIAWAVEQPGQEEMLSALLVKNHFLVSYVLHVKGRKGVKGDSTLRRLQWVKEKRWADLHASLKRNMAEMGVRVEVDELESGEEEVEEERKRVLSAVKEARNGNISKGVARLLNKEKMPHLNAEMAEGLTKMLNVEAAGVAEEEYKKRREESVEEGEQEHEKLKVSDLDIKNIIRGAKKGIASARSGLRYEHLSKMVFLFPSLTKSLAKVATFFVNGVLPQFFYSIYCGGVAIGVPKMKVKGAYRPVVVIECLYKVFGTAVLRQVLPRAKQVLEPLQVSLSRCATSVLPLGYHVGLMRDVESVLLCLDMSSAYSCISRSSIEDGLKAAGLRDLIPLFKAAYGGANTVCMRVEGSPQVVEVRSGVFAGDSLAPLFFSVGALPALKKASEAVPANSESFVQGYFDDVFAFGHVENYSNAVSVLISECKKVGLVINPAKSVALSYSKQALQRIKSIPGFDSVKTVCLSEEAHIVLGAPVGEKAALQKVLEEKAKVEINLIQDIEKMFEFNLQAAYKCLQFCVAARSMHLLRSLPPSSLQSYMNSVDLVFNNAVQNLVQVDYYDQFRLLSYLPLRKGGLGLPSLRMGSKSAFLGAIADFHQISPSLLPKLSQVFIEALKDLSAPDPLASWKAEVGHAAREWKEHRDKLVERIGEENVMEWPETPADWVALGEKAQHKFGQVVMELLERVVDEKWVEEGDSGRLQHRRISNQQSSANAVFNIIDQQGGELALSNEDFRAMVRERLGVPEGLVPADKSRVKCRCGYVFNKETSIDSQLSDDHHLRSCVHNGGRIMVHDAVVEAVAKRMERRGMVVGRENVVHKNSNNRRSDITTNHMKSSSGKHLILDVSTAEVESYPAQGRSALGVATKREQEKKAKYRAAVAAVDGWLVPFVIESPTGALGKEAKEWLKSLQSCGPEFMTSDPQAYQQDLQHIMVAFHKGMAECARNLAVIINNNC